MQMVKPSPHMVAPEAIRMSTSVLHIGNTKITIHSPSGLIDKSSTEQQAWLREQWEARDPNILNLIKAMQDAEQQAMRKRG